MPYKADNPARLPRAIYHQWYSRPEWQAARTKRLASVPYCERCMPRGETIKATVVNHRVPHKGDWRLFIDQSNHESVCKPCHDGLIQREETRGHRIGWDASGRPIDPDHPWNKAR